MVVGPFRQSMKAIALPMVLLMLTATLAGCTGGDPDGGDGTDGIDAETLQGMIEAGLQDFMNNTTVEITTNYYTNETSTTTNNVNGSGGVSTSSLHALSGTDPGESSSLFSFPNYYNSLTLLVREDAYPAADAGNSSSALNGAAICVGIGTITENNIVDWFSSMGISFTSVPVADAAEATAKFIDGSCDAFTGDMSAMVSKKWQLDGDSSMCSDAADDTTCVDIWIASELMSKEPLGAATRDMDSDFKDVVAWVWYGMVTAEEMGVTAANAAASATAACDGSNPGMCRLLTENLGLGTATNPLAGTWMQAVLGAAGNYGEAYDDAFCDGTYDGVSGSAAMTGCLISRVGTLNALVSEGGIQYAPAMR